MDGTVSARDKKSEQDEDREYSLFRVQMIFPLASLNLWWHEQSGVVSNMGSPIAD